LSTIDILYPGVGFVPKFLQKQIKMLILDEENWEPLINRGGYREKVASPDIILLLQSLIPSISDEALKKQIQNLIPEISVTPLKR